MFSMLFFLKGRKGVLMQHVHVCGLCRYCNYLFVLYGEGALHS